MANEFLLEIVTPERVVFSEKVTSLSVRAEDGRLGILHDHRPLVTKLKISPMTFKKDGESRKASINGSGYLEATPEKVTVLCEVAELDVEIDVERARRAKERAEERLKQKSDNIDTARAEAALNRAISRLNAAGNETE